MPERMAKNGWLVRPLALLLGALALAQLSAWVPHYLTWPPYADHDVFATAARAWDAGLAPYRDLRANNFPGTTYLFWLVGRLCGWGKTWPFFAADAGLVVAVAAGLVAWSHRLVGGALPGLIGALGLLGYVLDLDYALAAQRDGQASLLAIAGLLVLQAARGGVGRVVSALFLAAALIVRPQPVVFLPAFLAALWARPDGETTGRGFAVVSWGIALAIGLVLGFLPLIAGGLFDDFLRGIRLTAPGSLYNRTSPVGFATEFLKPFLVPRYLAVGLGLATLLPRAPAALRRAAWPWVVATLGALLYKPMSPFPHAYLAHPLRLVWAVDMAILAALLIDAIGEPRARLVALLLLLAVGGAIKPRFANPGGSVAAIRALGAGGLPEIEPPGYRPSPGLPSAAYYPWAAYRGMMEYLRANTTEETRIANALHEVPAICGPLGRLPAFPAESVAWLKMVRPDDEPVFAEALRTSPGGTVVVWIPGEIGLTPGFRLSEVEAAIRAEFELESRFGRIEVWRKPATTADSP